MSTPIAQPAINTLVQMGDGNSPEVFTTVANVSSITGLGLSAMVQDVTSHSTAVPWREKITTLLDAGDLSFDIFFIPNDTGHKALLAVFTGRTLKDWRLVFPDTNATKWLFQAYISKFSMSAPVDGVIKAAITFSATGQPTFPA